MFRVLFILIVALALMFPTLAQDDEGPETEEMSLLSLNRGDAEELEVLAAYLLEGEKVERRLKSDYFVTNDSLQLEEGSWSLLATGLGADATVFLGF